MRTQLSDTHPEAERVQIELLRKAGIAGAGVSHSLVHSADQLSNLSKSRYTTYCQPECLPRKKFVNHRTRL